MNTENRTDQWPTRQGAAARSQSDGMQQQHGGVDSKEKGSLQESKEI